MYCWLTRFDHFSCLQLTFVPAHLDELLPLGALFSRRWQVCLAPVVHRLLPLAMYRRWRRRPRTCWATLQRA
jgi:hypothetical protein